MQPSLKISYRSKLLTNRQTNRQINNNDYITSLAEVIKRPSTIQRIQPSSPRLARMARVHRITTQNTTEQNEKESLE